MSSTDLGGAGGSGTSGGGGGAFDAIAVPPRTARPTTPKAYGHLSWAIATTLPTALARAKIIRRAGHRNLTR